ncbi:HAD-like domain-containing protein [Calycina marina]|uniref:HAD-like domain-containing protein n=1 Tax=Calycina marina TaxID=1763456 RepID=A0A9P7Z6P5_9HELO|nr:HAD-like domain-containing protein [Calycina marina]
MVHLLRVPQYHSPQLETHTYMKPVQVSATRSVYSKISICRTLVPRSIERSFAMSASSKQPRRFAPLKEGGTAVDGVPTLKGIVFDVDGTLCLPQNYMFAEMRNALQIEKPTDILDHIYTLPPEDQEIAFQKIRDIESTACSSQAPQPGLLPLMQYLDLKCIRKGICTRNFNVPVNLLLSKFLPDQIISPIVTRDFRPPKPDPAGILHNAKTWNLTRSDGSGNAEHLIMVGDSIDDMTAGYRAGAATVLLVNEVNAHLATHEHTDLCISRLDELIQVLENGFEGRVKVGEESNTKERAEKVLVGRKD